MVIQATVGSATSAQLSSPYGVFVDTTGVLYIGDILNHVIRKVDTDGTITTFAGTGETGNSGDGEPPANARFSAPGSICMDAKGNLYIADPESHVIRKISACSQAAIIFQPEPSSACINDNAVFYAESADNNATYSWKVNEGNGWVDLSDGASYTGTATRTLTVKNISSTMNGYQYHCMVSNSCSQVVSQAAILTVTQPTSTSTLNIQSLQTDACAGNRYGSMPLLLIQSEQQLTSGM